MKVCYSDIMKVIKKGLWKKRITCRDCNSVLAIEEVDIKYFPYIHDYGSELEEDFYIECPVCGNEISIKKVPTPIKERIKSKQ